MAQRPRKPDTRDPLTQLRELKTGRPVIAMPEKTETPIPETESGRYQDLLAVTESLASPLDLRTILDAIVGGIIRVTSCERGCVMLPEEGDIFAIYTGRSRDGAPWEKSSARLISSTVVQRVVETYQPYIAGDVGEIDSLRDQDSIVAEKIRSVVALPLIEHEQLIGVIYADSTFLIPAFGESDHSLLRAFSAQAAIAIARARRHGEVLDRGERLEEQNRQLRAQLGQHVTMSGMVIRNQRMLDVFTMVDKIARGDMSSVLIHGESGTGKELLSRAIHARGPRRGGPFVAFNAAALTPTLVESALFGHRKGAFTGADFDKQGYFEVASGGTLFLDEIGEMPPELQSKLLRALQEKEIERMGEEGRVRKVDVNVVAATNKDLPRAVKEGRFREDLYYRLNAAELYVPPLRERREDILPLAEYFLKKFAEERKQPLPSLSRDARAFLAAHAWPGNVRELENMMEWALAFQDDNGLVSAEVLRSKIPGLNPQPAAGADDGSLRTLVDRYEERIVRDALTRNDNNVSATAKALGLSRQMLHEKIKKYGIVTRES